MKTARLTEHECSLLSLSLRTAAETFARDAEAIRHGEGAQSILDSLAETFRQQAAEAVALAERIEGADAFYVEAEQEAM